MILPTKHLDLSRSMLGVGAEVLPLLGEPKSVSRLWDDFKAAREQSNRRRIPFGWFVLTLDMLYMAGAIEYSKGRIATRQQHDPQDLK